MRIDETCKEFGKKRLGKSNYYLKVYRKKLFGIGRKVNPGKIYGHLWPEK